ncbi:MAG TPA: peptide chain release factor N(5)-glutamine methyltransferase [Bauldia sp.]|nr:peptide chain release factor N(5)-glutamine methyltransferase [Bauldia sp.]
MSPSQPRVPGDLAPTVAWLQRDASRRLRAAFAGDDRSATADLDARLLVAHVLKLDATALVTHADRPVAADAMARTLALVERRIAGEPVARILSRKEFWNFTLHLSPETLVPRPDTETVVEAALGWVRREGRQESPLVLLDVGVGSGAILLALLSELPLATGFGVDISPGAVRTARANAERLGLNDRTRFAVTDWTAGIAGRFDVVVSNPPYVETARIPALSIEVRDFDPDIALDGGPDGLDGHRRLLEGLSGLLAEEGAAFFEVGAGQASALGRLARSNGLAAAFHKDLAGTDRVVELWRVKTPR